MAKRIRYVCSECGHAETGWTGRCSACGAWGTMEETVYDTSASAVKKSATARVVERAISLPKVSHQHSERLDTGMEELNRVLGGGLVSDSVTMLTARPGAGKSTLLLQVAGELASRGIRTLYASGEESASQIKSRGERILKNLSENIYLISTDSMDQVMEECRTLHPAVLFLDSVQTMRLEELPQRQGSPTQTVQVTSEVVELCKDAEQPMACFLVGHMTKDETMAGLRTLEHLVDTVLYLEQGTDEGLRLLRSTKNRFGYTGEIGLFQMTSLGLEEVKDPYSMFLTKRKNPVDGSAVSLQKEGNRLIPIEIEALVSDSREPYPIRIGDTLRRDDLNTLIAILEQKAGIALYNKNVVLKATGGLSIREKGCDLAILAAIVSSARKEPIPLGCAFLAEVGLTGELKRVADMERRLMELARLGFDKVVIAKEHEKTAKKIEKAYKLEIICASTVQEVFCQKKFAQV
ncbi:MAG: DNA repair protein RadA [Peptoniphilaceae bacterium]|nr:DNA repair protein RadA [Peptoniphilaceae bacterium]MDY5766233.1 DNA repair protein RadA [Peptoniphilaceae bacterium]